MTLRRITTWLPVLLGLLSTIVLTWYALAAHPQTIGQQANSFGTNPYYVTGFCTNHPAWGCQLSAAQQPADCGVCTALANDQKAQLPDLDNCPGGPYATKCYDPLGFEISCANTEQADVNFNLRGDICDPCGNGKLDSGEQCDYGVPPRCSGPGGLCNNNQSCLTGAATTCTRCNQFCQLIVEKGGI